MVSPTISSAYIALIGIVGLACVVDLASATTVCPQMVANAVGLPKFCATNSYGPNSVSRPEFENWNCNHPFNSEFNKEKTALSLYLKTCSNRFYTNLQNTSKPRVCHAHRFLLCPLARRPRAIRAERLFVLVCPVLVRIGQMPIQQPCSAINVSWRCTIVWIQPSVSVVMCSEV